MTNMEMATQDPNDSQKLLPLPRWAMKILIGYAHLRFFGMREGWQKFRDRSEFKGLLEGSIVGNQIWHPDGNGNLIFAETDGAHVMAFDFFRPRELPARRGRTTPQLFEGKMYSLLISEIDGNPAHVRTPTELLDITRVEHFVRFNSITLEQALGAALLRQTTTLEAYQTVGLADHYAEVLAMPGIGDRPVYQVTPKGNTIISVENDGGKPKETPETDAQHLPTFGPRHVWALGTQALLGQTSPLSRPLSNLTSLS